MSVIMATPPTTIPVQNCRDMWSPKAGMDAGKKWREQSIARHGHENPRLSELKHEQYRS